MRLPSGRLRTARCVPSSEAPCAQPCIYAFRMREAAGRPAEGIGSSWIATQGASQAPALGSPGCRARRADTARSTAPPPCLEIDTGVLWRRRASEGRRCPTRALMVDRDVVGSPVVLPPAGLRAWLPRRDLGRSQAVHAVAIAHSGGYLWVANFQLPTFWRLAPGRRRRAHGQARCQEAAGGQRRLMAGSGTSWRRAYSRR